MIIEVSIIRYLRETLDVPCFAGIPELDRKGPYIVVEKTGGSLSNMIDGAMIAIQSYGDSLYEVAELNERVKAAMKNITEGTDISRAKLNSDYNFTDTDTKKYRYQALYDITYFG